MGATIDERHGFVVMQCDERVGPCAPRLGALTPATTLLEDEVKPRSERLARLSHLIIELKFFHFPLTFELYQFLKRGHDATF